MRERGRFDRQRTVFPRWRVGLTVFVGGLGGVVASRDGIEQARLQRGVVVLVLSEDAMLRVVRVLGGEPGEARGGDEGDGAAAAVERGLAGLLVQVAQELEGAAVAGGDA